MHEADTDVVQLTTFTTLNPNRNAYQICCVNMLKKNHLGISNVGIYHVTAGFNRSV